MWYSPVTALFVVLCAPLSELQKFISQFLLYTCRRYIVFPWMQHCGLGEVVRGVKLFKLWDSEKRPLDVRDSNVLHKYHRRKQFQLKLNVFEFVSVCRADSEDKYYNIALKPFNFVA